MPTNRTRWSQRQSRRPACRCPPWVVARTPQVCSSATAPPYTYRNGCRAGTETASPTWKAGTGTRWSSMNRNCTCAPGAPWRHTPNRSHSKTPCPSCDVASGQTGRPSVERRGFEPLTFSLRRLPSAHATSEVVLRAEIPSAWRAARCPPGAQPGHKRGGYRGGQHLPCRLRIHRSARLRRFPAGQVLLERSAGLAVGLGPGPGDRDPVAGRRSEDRLGRSAGGAEDREETGCTSTSHHRSTGTSKPRSTASSPWGRRESTSARATCAGW